MSAKSTCGAATPGTTARVGVEQVLDHHHRVVALLERLAVEEARKLGERLGVVVHRDRHVLLVGGELVADCSLSLATKLSEGMDANGTVDPDDA